MEHTLMHTCCLSCNSVSVRFKPVLIEQAPAHVFVNLSCVSKTKKTTELKIIWSYIKESWKFIISATSCINRIKKYHERVAPKS